jgi:hypothetical protein
LAKALEFVAIAGTAWAVARGASADEGNKASQKVVGYQATPHDGKKCSLCTQYRAPGSCQLVAGPINPDGWCRLFVAKGE